MMNMSTLYFLIFICYITLIETSRSVANFDTVEASSYNYLPNKASGSLVLPLTEIRDGYLMSLTLGTPPQLIQNLFFDTGSDLIWVPCANNSSSSFQCLYCCDDYYDHITLTIFNPLSSTSILRESCTSPRCSDIHSSENYYDPCTVVGCGLGTIFTNNCIRPCPSFSYTYGDGAVAGILGRDTLLLQPKNYSYSNISFGCVQSTIKLPLGTVGFGRGPLSLLSQLGFSKIGFSHCFLPFQFSGQTNISSPLNLGDLATSSKEHFQFTPMLQNPMNPSSYYIGLVGVRVGKMSMMNAPVYLREFNASGIGGMMIDSGTSYTHLPDPFYSHVLEAIRSVVKYPRAKDMEGRSPFDLCFNIPTYGNNPKYELLPPITFHFLNNVSLTLPKGTAFYKLAPPGKDSTQTVCLLFQKMAPDPTCSAVFGSFQQQNVEVVYDLQKERIGFHTTDCVSRGKSLSLQKDMNF